jgi:membrane-associated phospholipid phosphatase
VALPCLVAFALLAAAVAHGQGPYGFEDPAFRWLGSSTTGAWPRLAEILAVPAIAVVVVVCVALGVARGVLLRVLVYAALAATALLVSNDVAKPLVQRSYYGEPTFPSGNVTAVSATALAMWLALHPLLGNRARVIVFVAGVVWTLSMALAVVGALWHTPLDDLGSLLLSAGIVTGGAAVFERAAERRGRARGPARRTV